MKALAFLEDLLLRRLSVLEARRAGFVAGWQEADEWINSSRLILVLGGRINYAVNGTSLLLTGGEALLVPVDAQRSWSVDAEQSCELAWFRFEVEAGPPPDQAPGPPPPMLLTRCGHGIDAAAVQRLVGVTPPGGPAERLVAEAEVKLILARFLAEAVPVAATSSDPGPHAGDLVVNEAVRFLNRHHAEPDALAALTSQLTISPAHFRKLFRRQMGCSPRDHLLRRRMQVARHRLYHAREQVKQVAAAVGYADPLYFSRAYTAFWGHPPSRDQHRRWKR